MRKKRRNVRAAMIAQSVTQQLLSPRVGRKRKLPTNPVEIAIRNIGTGDAEEAAKLVGIHRNTMYRLMKRGTLDGSPHWIVRRISDLSKMKLSILAPKTYGPADDQDVPK